MQLLRVGTHLMVDNQYIFMLLINMWCLIGREQHHIREEEVQLLIGEVERVETLCFNSDIKLLGKMPVN